MNDNNGRSNAVKDFLVRSMLIGFLFALPAMFFAPTRAVFRFIRDLEAVQMATELFLFAVVLTLLGLILQGLFYFVRSALRFLLPEDANGTQENHTGE
jgi:hypothetical protein